MNKDFEAFKNRLSKMAKHFGKWARRTHTYCCRIYDADLPDFPFSIDQYENRILVFLYERGDSHLEDEDQFLKSSLSVIKTVFNQVPESHFYFKRRRVQKGKNQYDKFDKTGAGFVVRENQYKFWINLNDYLDTGLFLDHRNTRKMVGDWANNKQILNLFAYTGSFSVYAAGGGAKEVVTVDLSNTYLEWAHLNFELNDIPIASHRFERSDVLQWLRNQDESEFDLIICDPPTFSNSKKMKGTFDVQRDHIELIQSCLKLLRPEGKLVFSTNNRQFKLKIETGGNINWREISNQTVPMDFRNKKIHQCYLFEKLVV